MSFKIQYISDIHLEMRQDVFEINSIKDVKNIALCGDIGYPSDPLYKKFIERCSKKFENVFVIYGNHEYYSLRQPIETMNKRKKYAEFFPQNVYFMDNKSLFVEKSTNKVYNNLPSDGCSNNFIKIIGSTLWTNIISTASLFMNDYNHIYVDGIDEIVFKLSWNRVVDFHKQCVNYILKQLDANPEIDTLLLTHHAPHTIALNPERGVLLSSAYATYIPELYERKNLKVCIFGHTHDNIDKNIKEGEHIIRFVCNQVGYPYEKNVKYNPYAYVIIE